jgi:hypothetical protein
MNRPSKFSTAVIPIAILCLCGFLIGGCGKKKEAEKTESAAQKVTEAIPDNVAGAITSFPEYAEYHKYQKTNFAASYNPEYYKELTFENVYGQKVEPPAFDLNIDLSGKSLSELRILRNTIYARHGFLFTNSVDRGYFNQFPWYQPVYWDSSFKIELTEDEAAFVKRVQAEEDLRLKKNYLDQNGVKLGNTDNLINREMFKNVPDNAQSLLKENNFFLSKSDYGQLYDVYDQNRYFGVPSYITTDLYLQLLHVYYKHLMMGLEKEDLYPLVKSLVKGMYAKTLRIYMDKSINEDIGSALEFNLIYLAVAGNLLEEGSINPPEELLGQYKKEYSAVLDAGSVGSDFLNDEYFDYTQFKARGSYENDAELNCYFRGMKWLLTAPVYYQDKSGLRSAALFAHILRENPDLLEQYNRVEKVIAAFAGEGDNLSPLHVLAALGEDDRLKDLSALGDDGVLAQLTARLTEMDTERIHAKGGTEEIEAAIDKPCALFFPSRYNFDGEILQNLVHPLLAQDGKRLYPKGLDIFAVLGNSEAEKILLQEYKETETWPGYADALKGLKDKFAGFKDWDKNLFNKRMGLILNINKANKAYPGFMQTASWQRRALIASLAGWTEVKNELILHQKQPLMAEAGEGGGPPPPVVSGYVEPNIAFWQGSLNLLNFTHEVLVREGLSTTDRRQNLSELFIVAEDILSISEKELQGKTISDDEFLMIENLGSRIERISFYMTIEPEEENEGMGLAADVYTYHGPKSSYCLEETVGNADIIWVVSEINGLLYLTRGASFSYYEFTEPISSRLTDYTWRERLRKKQIPERPAWTEGLYSPVAPEVKTGYSDTSYPMTLKWEELGYMRP